MKCQKNVSLLLQDGKGCGPVLTGAVRRSKDLRCGTRSSRRIMEMRKMPRLFRGIWDRSASRSGMEAIMSVVLPSGFDHRRNGLNR